MDTIMAATVEDEVMGIVISRGSRAEAEPRFSAYVWGPATDAEPEPATKVA